MHTSKSHASILLSHPHCFQSSIKIVVHTRLNLPITNAKNATHTGQHNKVSLRDDGTNILSLLFSAYSVLEQYCLQLKKIIPPQHVEHEEEPYYFNRLSCADPRHSASIILRAICCCESSCDKETASYLANNNTLASHQQFWAERI